MVDGPDRPALARYLGWAAAAYLVSITLGLILRIHMVVPLRGITFDNYLHAHSHTLYFGWAGVGVLALAFHAVGADGRRSNRLLGGLSVGAGAMFIAFLAGGYNPISIAISTLVMLGWYAAVAWWWRRARVVSGVAVSYLRAGFGYMVLSTFGIWTLAYLQASEKGTVLTENLAVHAFLLGFSWFFIFTVIGLLLAWSHALGFHPRQAQMRRALRWATPVAWLTFPLGVVGGAEFGLLGAAARGAALLLLFPAWIWVREMWQGASGRYRLAIRTLVAWFAAAALMGAGAAAGLSSTAVAARHPVVLYLHILLLGFITGGLGLAGSAVLGAWRPAAWWHHHLGLALMAAGLAGASLAVMSRRWVDLLAPGLWLALLGGLVTYGASLWWAWPWLHHIRPSGVARDTTNVAAGDEADSST